ncbi:MAG: L-aspartate oxidase [Nocardioidaceae bacterium]
MVVVEPDEPLSAPLRRLPAIEPRWEDCADVVVVGAGAAGLSAARVAAEAGRDVAVLVKGDHLSGATAAAQGGLAAVSSADDSPHLHGSDTVAAGAGLCDMPAVSTLVSGAPAELAELCRLGAGFDRTDSGSVALTREGGHSRDRVIHAGGDASGAEVDRVLRAGLPPLVRVLSPVALVDVLVDASGEAVGVLAARIAEDGALEPGVIRSRAVVLATGGFGQAFATTTSPDAVTGDGVAAALRAGATLQDMEFVQFHPTVLWSPEARGQQPLLTEALRGEGAVLVDATGSRVMSGVHPMADLAPRDVVAAAMVLRMREAADGLDSHLYLDARHLGAGVLERRFPTVLAACRSRGIDPVRDLVPVAPGAHYTCGGVRADLSGRTDVPGLFAVGEAASSGVHGANRLASNSLTEALLMGRRCGHLLARHLPSGGDPVWPVAGPGSAYDARAGLAADMSRDAGVSRDSAGLERMLKSLDAAPVAEPDGGPTPYTLADLEATSLHTVSTSLALAALARTESRGCHRRSDHPASQDEWRRRLVLRAGQDAVTVAVGPRLLP